MIIYKYPLEFSFTVIPLPSDARILSAALQNGVPHVWVLLDPDAPLRDVLFHAIPTGRFLLTDPGDFIDTIHTPSGLIFHVFIIRP